MPDHAQGILGAKRCIKFCFRFCWRRYGFRDATQALAGEPIALRDMGSFHVGGRVVEISGKPVKELVLGAGGVPAKIDPNGLYQVEQMYVQYFLPQNRKGKISAADVARRRTHRRHLRDDARRPRRLDEHVHPQGLGRLQFRCGRARPLRLCAARRVEERAELPDHGQSVRALPHRAGARAHGMPIRPR